MTHVVFTSSLRVVSCMPSIQALVTQLEAYFTWLTSDHSLRIHQYPLSYVPIDTGGNIMPFTNTVARLPSRRTHCSACGVQLPGDQPMLEDEQGPYVRPPGLLAEVLKAMLTLRQRLASHLVTLAIDIAPQHATEDIRQVLLTDLTPSAWHA